MELTHRYAATTGQNPNATTDDFTASMADLSAALQTATASLSAIQPDSVTSKRQTESDVATLVADIVTVSGVLLVH
jgi:hypothetical protein